MKERDEELEDLFRERFSEKEAPISPRVWNNIKNSLPPEGADKKSFWKNPKNFFTIAIGTVLTGTALWWLLSNNPENKEQALSNKSTVTESKNNNEKVEGTNSFEQNRSLDHKERGSENSATNGAITENVPTNENTTSDGQTIETRNDQASFDSNINSAERNQKDGIDIQKNNSKNELTKQTQVRKNAVEYKDKTNTPITGVINNGSGNKKSNYSPQIPAYTENKQTNENLTLTERSAKDNLNKSVTNDKINNENLLLNNKDKNNMNRLIGVVGENSQNGHSFENKSSSSQDKGNNKNDLTQNESNQQNKTIIQTPSEVLLIGDVRYYELTQDSSGNAIQKENTTKDHNTIAFNAEPKKENNTNDSLANVLAHQIKTQDSIKPVADTMTTSVLDSTAKKDSTVGKEKENPSKTSPWSLDLILGPMLTGASTRANDLAYRDIVNAKNEQDKNQLNFSGGAMVNYSFSSKFYLSSGLMYSGYSEKYNFNNTKQVYTVDSHIEYDSVKIGQDTMYTFVPKTVYDTTNVSSIKYSDQKKDRYSFISVPLHVSMYIWRREKLSLLASAGIRANLMMKSTTYITDDEMTRITEYSGTVHKLSFSYMASVALEYQLKKKLHLLVQPILNYQAGSIYTKSSALNQKPYSIGVNVGLRFKF